MSFVPSKYQQAIYDHIKNTRESLIVEAVAGSGKTTTIVQAAKLIPPSEKTLFCAFNKSIATELSERLPENIECCTLNSLGHRTWMKAVGRVKLNMKKTLDIIDSNSIQNSFDKWDIRKTKYAVKQLVSYAKQVGIVPSSVKDAKGLVHDSDTVWWTLITHFNVDVNVKRSRNKRVEERRLLTEAINIARMVLKISLKRKNEIDFDDQLYMPTVYDVEFPKYDTVFVDEAQDVSHIQRMMLKKTLSSRGRLIAVGDPAQAIYGFRGADSRSLENIAKEFNAISLPLSISYRCPKLIVDEARNYMPSIESHKDAIDGKIEYLGVYSKDKLDLFKPNDFVLCRNVAPLVKLAFTLIGSGRPAAILGRDIGKQISALIKKLDASDLNDLLKKLHFWQQDEIAKLQERDPEATGQYIVDRADTVREFVRSSGATTVDGVIEKIESLFCEKVDGVVKLSTVHKSKGLEAKRVIILDRHLMPSKYATQAWQLEQENNLIYVAVTRSMEYLGYVESPSED